MVNCNGRFLRPVENSVKIVPIMNQSLFSTFFFLILVFSSSFSIARTDEAITYSETASPESTFLETEAERQERAIIERYWTILAKSPRRGTALERVYGFYVDTGQLDELMRRCNELTQQNANDAKTWLLLGHMFAKQSDDVAMLAAFEKAARLDPDDPLAPFYCGEGLIAQGKLREAAQSLEQAFERIKRRKSAVVDTLPILQTLGRVYERFGDLQKSTAVWESLEEMFPDDLIVLAQIAETLDEEGKTEAALARYEKLIDKARKVSDRYALVRFTLAAADLKIRLGNKDDALKDFETLLRQLAPGSWLAESVQDRIERLFARSADYVGLADYYRHRLETHPNNLDTALRLARTLVRLSRSAEAQTLLEKTLQRFPENIPLRLALIDLFVFEKNFDEVDRQYAKVEELTPKNLDYVIQRGLAVLENRTLDKQPRKDLAYEIWNRLIIRQPNNISTLIVVADLCAGAEIEDKAEQLYRRAIALRPNEPTYREYLGYFFHRRGDSEQAVAAFKQIAEDDRRTAENLAQLGGILNGLGYKKDALEALREATELKPNNFALRLRLVESLVTNREFEGACKQLLAARTLIESEDDFENCVRCEIRIYQNARDLDAASRSLLDQLLKKRFLSKNDDATRVTELLQSAKEVLARSDETFYSVSVDSQSRRDARLPVLSLDDENGGKIGRFDLKPEHELWRLAIFLQVLGRDEAAMKVVEAALHYNPNALSCLNTAAQLYSRGRNQLEAVRIFERLAAVDLPRRVEHLKQLANTQRELGQNNKAIETARLVMATGAGNAANARFYADMLFSVGKRTQGIETLRRAVRLDPTDRTTLNALANALAENGQSEEAMEILWRIFQRTEQFQEKLGLISRLAQYYQQERQFNRLVERLKQMATGAAERRESAYYLAQAYITVSDYDSARLTLEGLLVGLDDGEDTGRPGEKGTAIQGDSTLFSQLSRIAELQNDLPSATRYQELLCELTDKNEDRRRLLDLYYAGDEQEKARGLYLKMLLANSDLADRIAALDSMLGREEYEAARTFFERISPAEASNWELLYRKMQLSYWTGDFDGAKMILAQINNIDLPPETLGAEKERFKAKNPSPLESSSTTGTTTGPFAAPVPYSPYAITPSYYGGGASSSWLLAGHGHHAAMFQIRGIPGIGIHAEWNGSKAEILPTIFREYLQPQQNHGGYSPWLLHGGGRRSSMPYPPGSGGGFAFQAKPLFKPDSFGDVQFAARFWAMKFAIDADNPEDVEKMKSTGKLNSERKILDGHFSTWLENARRKFPEDSPNKDVLIERLRIESMRSPLTILAEAGLLTLPKDYRETTTTPLYSRIVQRLALGGNNDYRQAAFQIIQTGFLADFLKKRVEESLKNIDPQTEIAGFVEKLGETLPSGYSTVSTDQLLDLFEQKKKFLDDSLAEEKLEPYTLSQKLDWMFELWRQMALAPPGRMQAGQNFQQYLSSYDILVRISRDAGRPEDVARLDELVEHAGRNNPQIFIAMVNLSRNPQTNIAPFWELMLSPLLGGNISLPLTNAALDYISANKAESRKRNDEQSSDHNTTQNVEQTNERELEMIQTWLVKAQEAAVALARQQAAGSVGLRNNPNNPIYVFSSSQNTLLSFAQRRIASVEDLLPPPEMPDASRNHVRTNHIMIVGYHYPIIETGSTTITTDSASKKRTLSANDLERLLAVESDVYRVLDLCFRCTEIFEKLREEQQQAAVATRGAGASRRPPEIANLLSSGGLNTFSLNPREPSQYYEIAQALFGNDSRHSEIALLNVFSTFLPRFDKTLANALPGDGVDASQLEDIHRMEFEKYLQSKENSDSKAEQDTVAQFRFMQKYALAGDDLYGHSAHNRKVEVAAVKKLLEDDFAKAVESATREDRDVDGQRRIDSFEFFRLYPPNRLGLLARFRAANGQVDQGLALLDMLPLVSASEIRQRELMIFQIFSSFKNHPSMTPGLRKRTLEAAGRLRGFQLAEQESLQLRQGLLALGLRDEADDIRARLALTSNNTQTMIQLLNEYSNESSDGGDGKNEAVALALKVLRRPVSSFMRNRYDADQATNMRKTAIQILRRHGKLDDMVEQLEEQLRSSPGSFDMSMQLIGIYQQSDRQEDAKQALLALEKYIPEDPVKIQSYIQMLNTFAMNDESLRWSEKLYLVNPEFLFANFSDLENRYQQSNKLDLLFELIKKMSPDLLVRHRGQFEHRIGSWANNSDTKKEGRELLNFLWNIEGVSKADRSLLRLSLIGGMLWYQNEEWSPYLHEVVFERITVDESAPSANDPFVSANRRSLFTSSGYLPPSSVTIDNGSIHYIRTWRSERTNDTEVIQPLSLSTALLACWKNNPAGLVGIRQNVRKIIKAHEAIDKSKRDMRRYLDARIFDILIEIREDKIDEALKMLDGLLMEQDNLRAIDAFSLLLGYELVRSQKPEAVEGAIRCFEKTLKQGAAQQREDLPTLLLTLYLRSKDPGRAKRQAESELVKNIHILKLLGDQYSVNVGNRHYSRDSLHRSTRNLLDAMVQAGFTEDALLLYLRNCRGQYWFDKIFADRRYINSNERTLKSKFEELLERVDPETVAENIELFLPMEDGEANETKPETIIPTPIPIPLIR